MVARKVERRRGRVKRDVDLTWQRRYNAFRRAGFIDSEAKVAANKGLNLRHPQVRELLKLRMEHVQWFARNNPGWSRAQLEQAAADELLEKQLRYGDEELILFREKSI